MRGVAMPLELVRNQPGSGCAI